MGRTFKDKRKFDRKHDRNDGLKEPKRTANRPLPEDEEPDDFDLYELYEEDECGTYATNHWPSYNMDYWKFGVLCAHLAAPCEFHE